MYWDDRYLRIAEENYNLEKKVLRKISNIYLDASNSIADEIDKVYSKWGKITESPVFDSNGNVTDYAKALVLTQDKAMQKVMVDGKKITHLKAIQMQLDHYVDRAFEKEKLATTQHLKTVAEKTYYETIFETYRGIGVGQSFSLLSDSTINALIKNPVSGADFVERIGVNNQTLARNVNQTLTNGIIQGLSVDTMKRDLTSKINIGAKNAERIIRTETTNTMAQSALESYKASGVVDQYIYIATLDEKTSDACQELDGQILPIDKAVTGLNYPPMHPNCRSTTGAYFESMKDVGTRLAKKPDGETFLVPSSMKYSEFKELYIDPAKGTKSVIPK